MLATGISFERIWVASYLKVLAIWAFFCMELFLGGVAGGLWGVVGLRGGLLFVPASSTGSPADAKSAATFQLAVNPHCLLDRCVWTDVLGAGPEWLENRTYQDNSSFQSCIQFSFLLVLDVIATRSNSMLLAYHLSAIRTVPKASMSSASVPHTIWNM